MTRVIWSARAQKDISNIADYLSNKSIEAAENVIANILNCERYFLDDVFFSGQIQPTKSRRNDYHYLIEGHYKIIYYRKLKNVFIVKVFDTRQDPNKLKL